VAGCCKHSNEPSGSITGMEFDWLGDYYLLKKNSDPQGWLVGWLVGRSVGRLVS
jgi:hypothetical protein